MVDANPVYLSAKTWVNPYYEIPKQETQGSLYKVPQTTSRSGLNPDMITNNLKTKAMWLAVDEDKEEVIFDKKPKREEGYSWWINRFEDGARIYAPSGSIEKLIGRKLEWSDEPVEI